MPPTSTEDQAVANDNKPDLVITVDDQQIKVLADFNDAYRRELRTDDVISPHRIKVYLDYFVHYFPLYQSLLQITSGDHGQVRIITRDQNVVRESIGILRLIKSRGK